MISTHFSFCNSKKVRFIKEQQTKGFSSGLGLKTPLTKVSVLVIILF